MKRRQSKKAKLLAIAMAVAMAVTMTPAMAFAADGEGGAGSSEGPGGDVILTNPNIVRENVEIEEGEFQQKETTYWDAIYFGSYEQSETNGVYFTEPIKWKVLQVYDNNNDGRPEEAFVAADKVLDAKKYHDVENTP